MTLEHLEQELATMLNPLDIPGNWTPRERSAYEERRISLVRRISMVRGANRMLAELVPKIQPEKEWLAHLAAWRQTLCDELLSLPPRATTNKELGTQHNLKLSIGTIDRGLGVIAASGYVLATLRLGALMRAAGFTARPPMPGQVFGELPWSGSTLEAETRLRDVERRIADAQAQLAEALLDDVERERLAAELAEMLPWFNGLPKAERAAVGSSRDAMRAAFLARGAAV